MECAICMECLTSRPCGACIPCGHAFHQECFDVYSQTTRFRQVACPLCQQTVTPTSGGWLLKLYLGDATTTTTTTSSGVDSSQGPTTSSASWTALQQTVRRAKLELKQYERRTTDLDLQISQLKSTLAVKETVLEAAQTLIAQKSVALAQAQQKLTGLRSILALSRREYNRSTRTANRRIQQQKEQLAVAQKELQTFAVLTEIMEIVCQYQDVVEQMASESQRGELSVETSQARWKQGQENLQLLEKQLSQLTLVECSTTPASSSMAQAIIQVATALGRQCQATWYDTHQHCLELDWQRIKQTHGLQCVVPGAEAAYWATFEKKTKGQAQYALSSFDDDEEEETKIEASIESLQSISSVMGTTDSAMTTDESSESSNKWSLAVSSASEKEEGSKAAQPVTNMLDTLKSKPLTTTTHHRQIPLHASNALKNPPVSSSTNHNIKK